MAKLGYVQHENLHGNLYFEIDSRVPNTLILTCVLWLYLFFLAFLLLGVTLNFCISWCPQGGYLLLFHRNIYIWVTGTWWSMKQMYLLTAVSLDPPLSWLMRLPKHFYFLQNKNWVVRCFFWLTIASFIYFTYFAKLALLFVWVVTPAWI